MGSIKPTYVKRAGHELFEKHGPVFTEDFDRNKELVNDLAVFQSKNLRNRVAGYVTRLARRAQD